MKDLFVILGAGGHGRVLLDTIRLCGGQVLGFTDPDPKFNSTLVDGVPVLGSDEAISNYSPTEITLVNGMGSTISTFKRTQIYSRWRSIGYRFNSIIHPSSTISRSALLREGVQIMAGSVIQPGTIIGDNSIINTGVVIEHDCRIGRHVHVAPGAILSGGVAVGDRCHIGVGATIIQGITVEADCFVAAGAVVVKNLPPLTRVAGVPARSIF